MQGRRAAETLLEFFEAYSTATKIRAGVKTPYAETTYIVTLRSIAASRTPDGALFSGRNSFSHNGLELLNGFPAFNLGKVAYLTCCVLMICAAASPR